MRPSETLLKTFRINEAVPNRSSKSNFSFTDNVSKSCLLFHLLTHYQTTNFRHFQTERVCRRQFQTWRKWQTVIQTGRKHCGKRRNCSLRAISPCLTAFSKGLFPRGAKSCHCVGIGWIKCTLCPKVFPCYLNLVLILLLLCWRWKVNCLLFAPIFCTRVWLFTKLLLVNSQCLCPARVAQWWECRTHDLVVLSSIPGWGDFSFRCIFTSNLCRSMWGK